MIVATKDEQVAQLQSIIAKAAANGVTDLKLLSREEAKQLEPQLECVAAVHSHSTGIIGSHALMLSLQGDFETGLQDGALVAGYAGMRPKISSRTEAAADFMIQGPNDHGIVGLVNLFGIESPGLTSSMAIGQRVSELLCR